MTTFPPLTYEQQAFVIKRLQRENRDLRARLKAISAYVRGVPKPKPFKLGPPGPPGEQK